MALREITINGQPILVEVAAMQVEGQQVGDGFANSSRTDRRRDVKEEAGAIPRTPS